MQGAAAWMVYAIVECCFTSIFTRFAESPYQYFRSHWGFNALLFLLYPVLGAVVGVAAASLLRLARGHSVLLQRREFGELHGGVLACSLIAAQVANLVLSGVAARPEMRPALAILLTVAVVAVAAPGARASWPAVARSPWFVSGCLLGLPWLAIDRLPGRSGTTGLLVALAFALTLLSTIRGVHHLAARGQREPLPARRLVPVAAVVLLVGLLPEQRLRRAGSPAVRAPEAPDGPSVVLITLDTVRADHLSLYGYHRETTPFLTRLGASATVYTQALAPGDVTLSSHASLFTGLYPSRHRAHNSEAAPSGAPLAASFETLAERLAEAGYFTAGVAANVAYLSHGFGLDQGFHYYDNRAPVLPLGPARSYLLRHGLRNLLVRADSRFAHARFYRRAEEINDAVVAAVTASSGRRPLFLFINYMDAHFPYAPPPPFDRRFPGGEHELSLHGFYALQRQVLRMERQITADERRFLESRYDGELAYLDHQLARLAERLQALRLWQDALVIVTSDHGEAFGDRDLMDHGVSVHQDQVRVPLLVRYPGGAGGGVVEEPVSVVDILPTILEVAGVESSGDLDGESLLRPGSGSSRLLITESFPYGVFRHLHPRFERVERGVVSGPFKLIASTAGRLELFNLVEDAQEQRDVKDQHPELAARLEEHLRAWLAGVTEGSEPGILEEGAEDRLRALGYLD